MRSAVPGSRIIHPSQPEEYSLITRSGRHIPMAKFRITHDDWSTTEVEAAVFNQDKGYFHFTAWQDGESAQVLSIKESSVVKVEKID